MKTTLKMIAFAAAILMTVPAFAADFSTPIKQIDGKVMQKEDKSVLTVQEVATTALLSAYQDEPNLSGIEKNTRFWLARKIQTTPKDPPLTVDEIKSIKDLVAKAYSPLIVGQVWSLLDPGTVPSK